MLASTDLSVKYDEEEVEDCVVLEPGAMLEGFTRTDWIGANTVALRPKPLLIIPMIFPLCWGNQLTGIRKVAETEKNRNYNSDKVNIFLHQEGQFKAYPVDNLCSCSSVLLCSARVRAVMVFALYTHHHLINCFSAPCGQIRA